MPLATMDDACREYVYNAGAQHPDHAWILSPWDSWHRNPFYLGPPQKHPEDDSDADEPQNNEPNAVLCAADSLHPDSEDEYDIPF